ncbi:NAD(P)-binding protein [Anaeromyces robustus]|uniref:NAD(P)-binding protein n=1 Tax=Anaeromyces robustus TaxID=1754192 RepID=A0A1Y1WY96_9FUNG|nr:NAD(P)-binding protein [Anaeromyces robustus]|eukprot:ORX78298.1 NAD(P)-binding protein [Anaeromyces robustus]
MIIFYILITCIIAFTINFILKGKPDIIDDEKVLIIGASSGIGKYVALEYAARNANIILAARRTELLEKVKKECLALDKTKVVEIIKCDITNEDDLIAVVEKVKKDFGQLNTVIVNAGVINILSFDDLLNNDKGIKGKDSESSKVIDKIFKINTYGPIYAAKYFIPLLKETKGRFVVVSSLAALISAPTRALYSASKHALMGFFNSLRMEIADTGVSITLVCPGSVSDTGLRVSAIDKITDNTTPVTTEEEKPKKEKKSLFSFLKITPKQCAKAIVEASDWRVKEVVIPGVYKVAVLLNSLAPSLIEMGAKLKYHFKK